MQRGEQLAENYELPGTINFYFRNQSHNCSLICKILLTHQLDTKEIIQMNETNLIQVSKNFII